MYEEAQCGQEETLHKVIQSFYCFLILTDDSRRLTKPIQLFSPQKEEVADEILDLPTKEFDSIPAMEVDDENPF